MNASDHGTRTTVPFTEEEIRAFQRSDKQAGGTVVGLMTSIFTIGLLLYTFVAATL
jgi:hypothetical protein